MSSIRNIALKPKTNLSVVSHYSIDLVKKDTNTYSVKISDVRDGAIIADLPLDPMDNTLAAVLSADAMSKLGTDAANVLETLSKVLQEQIGAKEFVILPPGAVLPDYIPAQDHEFKRPRQASRADLEKNISGLLNQHKDLVAELDNKFQFTNGKNHFKNKLHHKKKPHKEIFDFIAAHANFTPEKMAEYKKEGVPGIKARFKNSNVSSIAMVSKQDHHLYGIIRCLAMGNKFGYLSDETINQEILPLNKFSGANAEQQEKNRAKFLLAYFTDKALQIEKTQEHFLIIAADKREDIYDAIGFQPFPVKSKDYVVTIKLGKPGPLMNAIKEDLIKPFSNVGAVNQFGINATPAKTEVTSGLQEENQQGLKVVR